MCWITVTAQSGTSGRSVGRRPPLAGLRLLPPASRKCLQDVVKGNAASTGDRQPQKECAVLGLVVAEKRLQRSDLPPFGRFDRDNHGDTERAGGNARHESEQQENPAEKLNPRDERCEELREGYSPLTEVFDHRWKIVQFPPATPHENPPDDDASE